MQDASPLLTTPLSHIWQKMGARMVAFAGYFMPVQFIEGVMKEHVWTRNNCGLFDVSHMGPAFLSLADETITGERAHLAISALVEALVPCDVAGLAPGQLRYTTLLNDDGGVLDDLFVGRPADPARQGSLYFVVNAGSKEQDFKRLVDATLGKATLHRLDNDALIAVQGPKAIEVIDILGAGPKNLGFMELMESNSPFGPVVVSRSGYTGEDGFEVLVSACKAEAFVTALLANQHVKAIGLGARDSLRLEAGLCLYGHDLDETISPIEAGLAWTIQKRRREQGSFPGSARILSELSHKPSRKRVGLVPRDKAPARDGTPIHNLSGRQVGHVTSGGFGPTVGSPIAMGYVEIGSSTIGTELDLIVRDQPRRWTVTALPFVPHKYYRKG
ncbi:glycine cleavage system aminomethyltransferase GcvT [Candidatus Phycosocius spiralis]|uniref:aminomethyltransferase n=1 Tax=Candidatus Phycosocius spiralis TaxID=2815099 RepID=A0ABQ4PW82_9PROT|nr:glycine cleavage system aminomethyltransferase GcvT [Candidatus Phycosocius spiralis]GIU67319.1 aminomethyltransferase [Candidatus Phycosocius spiralis]